VCTDALKADAKNYHAWAHRQVVVAAAGAWQQEMEYLEELLQQDVRNNSAWNQRAFVIRVSHQAGGCCCRSMARQHAPICM
jgi:protein farnesyltransferase/geranylgeranyltransferase type-1 subunit alpha